MGNKPKKSEYQATESEKASAAVAMAEYKYFKEKYGPLLRQMRDQSLTEDTTSTLRGRANADTMQALTSTPQYQNTQSLGRAGDMAQAYQGQLGIANEAGKKIQNTAQTNVLGTARGQAADAQSGMAKASRLATSEALTRAKAKQDVRMARLNAATQVATAMVGEGAKNIQGGGTFFTPNKNAGNPNAGVELASGFKDRLGASMARGGF